MPSEITIITFGCRLNTYESEAMRVHAEQAGLTNVVILNGCAVTAEAERQLRQSIRKAHRENPSAKIIVTGCAAQIGPDHYANMPEVDFVIGNDVKMKVETYRELAEKIKQGKRDSKIVLTNMKDVRETASPLVQGFEGKTRAFIQVQNGCNNACTFCIIPQGRGPSRSVPVETIIAQVRALSAQNYPEIALTGVDIASYGADLPSPLTLGGMVKILLAEVPEMKWLRLSSLDPAAIDDDLWDVIAHEPRMLPYLHLSLQAGDDIILKRMARRHRRQDIIDLCARARSLRPDMTFGADIIAGFPTETDDMFANTLALVEEMGLTWLHVFPYSARKGTPAARMPQVKVETRKARAAKLREVGARAVQRHLDSLVGQRIQVHVEQPTRGRTPTFAEVVWPEPAEAGTLMWVKITGRQGARLTAEKAE